MAADTQEVGQCRRDKWKIDEVETHEGEAEASLSRTSKTDTPKQQPTNVMIHLTKMN